MTMAMNSLEDDLINFKDDQHGSRILKKLLLQVENERFCDVVLHVQGKSFYAHRNVLAACSPYFDSILKVKKIVKEQLNISCPNLEVFQCLMNYMYTGNVIITKKNVYELLRLANNFLISELKCYCCEYLERFLDVGNCLNIREISEKYNMPSLNKCTAVFIQQNMIAILGHSVIMSYPLPKLENFLSQKDWKVPESILLEFLSRWVRQDLKNREGDLRSLLTFVNWPAMTSSEIKDYLDKDQLFVASEKCLYFVLQSLNEAAIHLPSHHQIYQLLLEKFTQERDVMDNDSFLGFAITAAIEGLADSPGAFLKQLDPECVPEDLSLTLSSDLRLKGPVFEYGTSPAESSTHNEFSSSSLEDDMLENSVESVSTLKFPIAPLPNGEEDSVVINEGVRCPHCEYFSSSMLRLEHHLSAVHHKDVLYKCSICNYTCKWSREYYCHMKKHFMGPPYRCDSCDYVCEKIHLLLSHQVKHVHTHPFKCDQCDYRSKTRTNLMTHIRSHTGEKPFQCTECDKSFATKATLDQHVASHSDSRPYLCDECGFSTKYHSHLLAHKRIHTGEVYYCQYPGCVYSSPKKSQLTAHMRTHMPERNHVCEVCGKGFVEKSHLSRHEKIHSNLKPFHCSTCSYSSTRRDKLKEHMKRHFKHNKPDALTNDLPPVSLDSIQMLNGNCRLNKTN